jgi:protein phosphatase
VHVGDRYLLCTDGLSTVVSAEELQRMLAAPGDPQQTVDALIALAHSRQAPDNVSCVVADVQDPNDR